MAKGTYGERKKDFLRNSAEKKKKTLFPIPFHTQTLIQMDHRPKHKIYKIGFLNLCVL